ncbi:hypothetical protein ACRRTK_011347 [Alexandromys fortis]
MERPHFPLAMGLALLALCLLTLSPDARAELRSRRIGERQNLSPNDPRVQRAAQVAVSTYNMGSNSLYYFRDTKIVDAAYQKLRCNFELLEVPWKNTTQLLKHDCKVV